MQSSGSSIRLIQHVKDSPLLGGNTRWSPALRLTTEDEALAGVVGTPVAPTKLDAVDDKAATATLPAEPTNEAGDPACGTRFGTNMLPNPRESNIVMEMQPKVYLSTDNNI